MDLTVDYKQMKTKEDAYIAVKNAITADLLARFKVSAQISYNENDKILANGKGFKLTMGFSESEVGVKLDLNLLLRPLRGKILEAIEKQINRVI